MSKELLVHSHAQGVSIAMVQDRQLIELHQERQNNNYLVGDIYLGRIKKVMPGLNATFVDVGYERDAFLHYLDLGPQVNSLIKFTKAVRGNQQVNPLLKGFKLEADINKTGKITEVVGKLNVLPVQIVKEPIASKGPRLSSEISLAGRYIVLVPFGEGISISKKIKSAGERNRLRKVVESIKPEQFGVIIRTVSEGRGVQELHQDMEELLRKWDTFVQRLPQTEPGQKIVGEMDRTNTLLRDILNGSFTNIYLDDEKLYQEVKDYIRHIAPEQEKIVKHYKGKVELFEQHGVDKQIKALFGRTVNLHGGAYLIIEHTEALHVIDVNSGNRNLGDKNQEDHALQVNLEAAKEIARQLRLRDMGGIIVVDFIDMHKITNKKALHNALIKEMELDRAKHNVLPPSKFGLVQITRQRVRPELNVTTTEKCPTCNGTGEISASILLVDEIESALEYILREQNEKNITLTVHPYIGAYLTKGLFSRQVKWFFKHSKWVKIREVAAHHFTEYHFVSGKEEEIKL